MDLQKIKPFSIHRASTKSKELSLCHNSDFLIPISLLAKIEWQKHNSFGRQFELNTNKDIKSGKQIVSNSYLQKYVSKLVELFELTINKIKNLILNQI